MGAIPTHPRRRLHVIRNAREISLDDWAELCVMCGEATRPTDNPHPSCIAYATWPSDRLSLRSLEAPA